MTFIALLAAAAALVGAPETAPAVPAASATSATPAAVTATHSAEDDKIICKSQEVTGSRFSTRVCATKADWDARTRAGRDYLDANTRFGHCPNGLC